MVLTARWVVPVPPTGAAPGNQPAQTTNPGSYTRWPSVSRSPEGAP